LFFEDNLDVLSKSLIPTSKVTIVGVGQVGMACAYSIITAGLCTDMVLADIDRDKVLGEVMDFNHAGAFINARVVAAGPNYEGTENTAVCVITAGVRQRVGEDRRSLLERNVKVFGTIIPPLVKLSPNIIFLVVSNPCDSLAYVAWKLSGLPKNHIIGSGTFLDTSRFRVLLAEKLHVSPHSIHAWILGEHGDSSVPIWSGVSIAGIPFKGELGNEKEWNAIHENVKNSAYEVIRLKGYTNWAIGAAVAQIVECIFKDSRRVLPLSTNVKGMYGIDSDVFLSLPCTIGRNGILQVLHTPLTQTEESKVKESAAIMSKLLITLDFTKSNL